MNGWVRADGCVPCPTVTLPLLSEDSHQVLLHSWNQGVPAWPGGPACEVLLYEVQGGKHSWALKDLDTCGIICEFFSRWLR